MFVLFLFSHLLVERHGCDIGLLESGRWADRTAAANAVLKGECHVAC